MRETERAPDARAAALPSLPDDMSVDDLVKERYGAADSRDIFSKVHEFTIVTKARDMNIYPFFQPLDNNDGPVASIYGKRVLMFGSNNYLGLTRHPYVVGKAQ